MDEETEGRTSESHYEPKKQDHYGYVDGSWQAARRSPPQDTDLRASTIRLITWNIDAQAQGGPLRMASALKYLEQVVCSIPETSPTVILLQEMVPNDLKMIQATEWIRQRFMITDVDPSNWQSPYYGTTTILDKRLNINKVFRVPYVSRMRRDGLFSDIEIYSSECKTPTVLRVCNTHLESLVADPPLRPGQVAVAAAQLQSPGVQAGVLAGDCNSIEPFDCTLHIENGLKDAYLEAGGDDDSESGFTWGYQSYQKTREKFGCKRMDKILYCGKVEARGLERIGMGVCVEASKRVKMRSWGALPFVTDHYGLMAELVVTE